jgi:hypothetical protein
VTLAGFGSGGMRFVESPIFSTPEAIGTREGRQDISVRGDQIRKKRRWGGMMLRRIDEDFSAANSL